MGTLNDFLSIFLDDDYYLERQNKEVSSVLDIGANLGFFSIAARNAFPNATIHSYEPNEDLKATSTRMPSRPVSKSITKPWGVRTDE